MSTCGALLGTTSEKPHSGTSSNSWGPHLRSGFPGEVVSPCPTGGPRIPPATFGLNASPRLKIVAWIISIPPQTCERISKNVIISPTKAVMSPLPLQGWGGSESHNLKARRHHGDSTGLIAFSPLCLPQHPQSSHENGCGAAASQLVGLSHP